MSQLTLFSAACSTSHHIKISELIRYLNPTNYLQSIMSAYFTRYKSIKASYNITQILITSYFRRLVLVYTENLDVRVFFGSAVIISFSFSHLWTALSARFQYQVRGTKCGVPNYPISSVRLLEQVPFLLIPDKPRSLLIGSVCYEQVFPLWCSRGRHQ